MKRKLLMLAAVMAVMSLSLASVSAQGTGSLSQAEVSVSGNDTLTISVSGDTAAVTCSNGLSAGVSNDSCNDYLTTGSIDIVDLTGVTDTGHEVTAQFDIATWTYDSTDSNYNDVSVSTATTGTNVIKFTLNSHIGEWKTYVTATGATCTPSLSLMDISTNVVLEATKANELIQNQNSCPATYKYRPADVLGESGTAGLGEGSYTNSATYTVSDGFTL